MDNKSLKHRSGVRALLEDVADEARWAVDDIRQEVVERPWFGRETTPEHVHDIGQLTADEERHAGPQRPAPPDLHDHDDRSPEPDRDIER